MLRRTFQPNGFRSLRHDFGGSWNFSKSRTKPPSLIDGITCKNVVGRRCLMTITTKTDWNVTNQIGPKVSFLSTSSSSVSVGIFQLLTKSQKELLQQQQILWKETQNIAKQVLPLQQSPPHTKLFLGNDNNNLLDSTFTVVMAGEFNAGKSSIVNALLGQKLLETGALPTTDAITVLTSQSTANTDEDEYDYKKDNILIHSLPQHPLLQDLTLIDTPGTNAVVSDHTNLTKQLLPMADLILFVTSADRPFPESEKSLLKSIQAYRKNIVILINKMDIVESSGGHYGSEQKQSIVNFVHEHAQELLGARPIVLPISAQHALHVQRLTEKNTRLWERSNFTTLEQLLLTNLTQETKIKSKLLNPVGVMEGTLKQCSSVLNEKTSKLQTDISTLQLLKSQMKTWRNELADETNKYQTDIQSLLEYEMRKCRQVMGQTSYIDQLSLVMKNDGTRFQQLWENRINASSPTNHGLQKELESLVVDCSDSIATMSRVQAQAVMEYLGKRPSVVNQNLIGTVTTASRLEDTRKNLIQGMTPPIQTMLTTYNSDNDCQSIFKSLQRTIMRSLGIQVSSTGIIIGTCVYNNIELLEIMYAGNVAVVCAAAAVISSGWGILVPLQNQHMIRDYESKWKHRSDELQTILQHVCDKELNKIHKQIIDGVSPYTRYVETEQTQLQDLGDVCRKLLSSCHTLRSRINKSQRWS